MNIVDWRHEHLYVYIYIFIYIYVAVDISCKGQMELLDLGGFINYKIVH